MGQPYGEDNKESIFWHRGHKASKAPCPPIYQALIHPHFNYFNTVLAGNCGITLRNKLQKLQIRAARFLTFSDYDEDAGYLFELPGWKNLARQHEIEKATIVSKSLHGLAPEYLCSRFVRETAYNLGDSENKLCVLYHGQIITTIALAPGGVLPYITYTGMCCPKGS